MDLNNCKRSIEVYRNELSEVPDALQRLCVFIESEGDLFFNNFSKIFEDSSEIYLFGMASSQWASWPIVYALNQLNRKLNWLSAYEGIMLSPSLISKGSLAIIASQSGETIEIKNLVNWIKAQQHRPFILGVTNASKSFLGNESDRVLNILAGQELHAPAKTFINTVAALMFLYISVTQDKDKRKELVNLLLKLSIYISNNIGNWDNWGIDVAKAWSQYQGPIQFLSSGPRMASAMQSSMLCSETAKIFSAVSDWATFRHGFEPQVNESFFAIGFKPSSPSNTVWQTTSKSILKRGGKIFFVPELPREIDIASSDRVFIDREMLAVIWDTLPIHYLCIMLAQQKGLDASQIERKITLDI